jgi:hypothetical protein
MGMIARWLSVVGLRCSMSREISPRQEPQLVPAPSACPTSLTLVQPLATALAIWLAPIPKQEQTTAPRSSEPMLGRPAITAMRAR